MGLLTPTTMHDEIMALYQGVYQLRRDPGEVQCSKDAAEEAHNEIFELLRVLLWLRQSSA